MSMEGAANQENSINFDNNWCRSLANEEGDVDEDERKPRNINRETMNDCVGQDSSAGLGLVQRNNWPTNQLIKICLSGIENPPGWHTAPHLAIGHSPAHGYIFCSGGGI